jgi:(4S)-4-hydroxy-5-phosphonooxypentane-2,3-dione isomerase
MLVNCVYVHVKADKIEDFIKATIENHNNSVKEPGNLRFDMLQDAKDPALFLLYEAYESDKAAAFHKTTPHYAIWRDTVAEWMDKPREGVKYNIITPLDKTQW